MRFVSSIVLALLAAVGLAGPAKAGQKPHVVASFSILADFAREIGGETIEVTSLVGPGGDAHVYQPTPADARTLAQADLVLVNGLGFEGWIDRLVAASGYDGPVVTASRDIRPLVSTDEEGNEHAETLAAHAPGDEHAPAHEHGRYDPHAWQDVANALVYARTIEQALSTLDPGHAGTYARNAARYGETLRALDAEIRGAIAALPADRRTVITSHDAFGYYAAAYGLAFLAPVGLGTETEPSAGDIAALIGQIRAAGVRALFVETNTDPRLVQQIARETGARIGGELYADSLSQPGGPASSYVEMMRYNTRTLTAALGS